MIRIFLKWYITLSEDEQKELLDYIFNNQIKSLNEGIFSGPIDRLEKGHFTGPISSAKSCPTCKRPY